MATEFKYWAFISYSHQNNRKGGNLWADWLHDTVENFKVPAELIGRGGRDGEPVPKRLFPAFQDEKELPTNADLGGAIQQALEQSRYLVVICSPQAAKSVYVNQEVLEFRRLGRSNRILAIIINGEPNASEPGKGLDPALECFPEALRHPLDTNGNLDLTRHAEPIAADVRDARGKEASLSDKAHRGVLEREKLRVIAGLLGVGFDELVQRDKERQLNEERSRARRLRRLVGGFAALAVVATLAGAVAFAQKSEADRQKNEADWQRQQAVAQNQEAVHQQREVRLAFSKADCAAALERAGNDQAAEAVAFLCRALRTNPENRDAASLLFSVLSTRNWAVPLDRFEPEGEEILALDSTGKHAVTRAGTMARVWDLDAHRVIRDIPDLTFGAIPPLFSPDGRLLILSLSNSLQKLDVTSGLRSPLGMGTCQYDWFSEAFRFSPDGRNIALGHDGQIQSWDLADNHPVGDPVKQPANPYDGLPSAISRDGSRLLYPWAGGAVTSWDPSGRLVTRTFERQQRDSGNPLRVWDAATGKPLPGGLPYSQTRVSLAAFSPDGQRLMAATMDDIANVYNTVRVWDIAAPESDPTSLAHEGNVSIADWSPDGNHVLTVSQNLMRIWDAGSGSLAVEPLRTRETLLDAWFSPDGSRIIGAAIDRSGVDLSGEPGMRLYALNPNGPAKHSFYNVKTASIWDAAALTSRVTSLQQAPWVLDAQFSPNGKWLVTTSESSAQIWDVASRSLRHSLPMDDVPVCLRFSSDGRRLLLVSRINTARVWDTATGQALTPPIHDSAEIEYAEQHNNRGVTSIGFAAPRHPGRSLRGALSPDGKRIALATGFGARIWDADTGQPLTAPLRHHDFVNTVCFSADDKFLLTASVDADTRVWEIATGQAVREPIHSNGQITTAAISPSGQCVAIAAADCTTQVWDWRTGQPASHPIKQAQAVTHLEFSPDGKTLLTLSGNDARVWNPATAEPISAPMRHNAGLTSARFSPDGNYVLTASEDRTARIWAAATGLPVSLPMLHDSAVNSASFSADGRMVASADEDGTVKIWPFYSAVPPSWVLDFAESLAGCSLDSTGTPSYLPGKPPEWLRKHARNEPHKTDPMVVWARQVLRVE